MYTDRGIYPTTCLSYGSLGRNASSSPLGGAVHLLPQFQKALMCFLSLATRMCACLLSNGRGGKINNMTGRGKRKTKSTPQVLSQYHKANMFTSDIYIYFFFVGAMIGWVFSHATEGVFVFFVTLQSTDGPLWHLHDLA